VCPGVHVCRRERTVSTHHARDAGGKFTLGLGTGGSRSCFTPPGRPRPHLGDVDARGVKGGDGRGAVGRGSAVEPTAVSEGGAEEAVA